MRTQSVEYTGTVHARLSVLGPLLALLLAVLPLAAQPVRTVAEATDKDSKMLAFRRGSPHERSVL